MDKETAKRILLGYRPGTADASEPEILEALRLADSDPELNEWLRQQLAWQATISSRLREIAVPPGLKERILARQKVVTPLWRRREFLLAAASLALLVSVLTWWLRQPEEDESFAGFRSRMVGFASRQYSMDILTTDPKQIREYLARQGAPADYVLTPALEKTTVKGGAQLSWQAHSVSMVCFDLPPKQTIYLFILDRSAFHDGKLPGPSPEIAIMHRLTTASWSRGGKIYLLAAPAPESMLKKLLSQKKTEPLPGVQL